MSILNRIYLHLEDLLFFGVCCLRILIPELFRLPKDMQKTTYLLHFQLALQLLTQKHRNTFREYKKNSQSPKAERGFGKEHKSPTFSLSSIN